MSLESTESCGQSAGKQHEPNTGDGGLARMRGEVADALEPDQKANYYRYPVKIDLDKNYLENKNVKVPLMSGMAITANIKLRDKRLISLISDIFVEQVDSIKKIRQQ